MAGSVELMSNPINPYAGGEFEKASQGDLSNGRSGFDNWFRNLVRI